MAELIRVLAAHVLPEFDDFAGAQRAGVGDYLALQLASDKGERLRKVYREIALALQRATPANHEFTALSGDQREVIIENLVRERVEEKGKKQFADHWRVFIQYCLEAYLCDPRWGGNRDGAGWRSIGVEGPQLPRRAL